MILIIDSSPRKKATDYVVSKANELLVERGHETEIETLRGKKLTSASIATTA